MGSEVHAAESVRVVVLATPRLTRDALAHALGARPGVAVAGAAGDAASVAALARLAEVDVVLADAGHLPPAALRSVVPAAGGAPVLVLVTPADLDMLLACAEAGVAGYVDADATLSEVAEALRRAADGELLCPPAIAAGLLHALAASPPLPSERALTAREREVLALLDEGLSNKEIAARLQIEVATVKNHVHNVLEKLQVKRRGAAAARFRSTRRADAESRAV